MNRRTFIQSLAAVFTLPATPSLSLSSAGAAVPAAAAVPAQARFWSIYMTALHGECTPQTLQNLLHIPEVDAKRYIGQLIADGVIKPNPLLQRTVTELVKPNDESIVDRVKKRFEKKTDASSKKAKLTEAIEQPNVDAQAEAAEELEQNNAENIHEDEQLETEQFSELDNVEETDKQSRGKESSRAADQI